MLVPVRPDQPLPLPVTLAFKARKCRFRGFLKKKNISSKSTDMSVCTGCVRV